MKDRADKVVVDRGLEENRQKALALIMVGRIFSNGQRSEKTGQKVDTTQEIIRKEKIPCVCRGGVELDGALDA